jgi:hypothetical protein
VSQGEAKSLLLTFDYELFLGSRSGTVDNCILRPTARILDILEVHSFKKAIFFVDTVYLWRLAEMDADACKRDFLKITEQLQKVKKAGHYIYPHLHPHWLDAEYLPAINQWNLNNSEKYSFGSISEPEKELVFRKSIEILSSIVGKQDVLGYRAGGWCIQPFDHFIPFFEKYNIKYEFSVLPGYSSDSPFINFNFANSPQKKCYSFSTDVNKEEKGDFIEYPISLVSYKVLTNIMNRLFIKFLYKRGIVNYGDGLSNSNTTVKSPTRGTMASIELLTMINLPEVVREFQRAGHLHFISHPKMLNPHNITCMEVLLRKVAKQGPIETDYLKLLPA